MAETSVRRVETDGRVAWRKTYSDGGTRRRVAALRWVARRLGANALLAPVPLSPELACLTEQAMIRRLATLGVRVPDILAIGERELLLSDIGPTLSMLCREEPDPGRRSHMLEQGLRALLDLHRRGGYLSQAFARNITLDAGGVGFIDLEEDPSTTMSLSAAQARDVLFYAHSTARFLADVPGAHTALLAGHLAQEPPAVRSEVAHTARALAWLVPLAWPFGARARAVAEGITSLRQAIG